MSHFFLFFNIIDTISRKMAGDMPGAMHPATRQADGTVDS